MRIKFLTGVASNTWQLDDNKEAEVPDKEAARFIEKGYAEAVDDARVATAETRETAARKKPRRG